MALSSVWTSPTEQTAIASSVTRQNEDVLQNILYLYTLLNHFDSILTKDSEVVVKDGNVVYKL